ncbi:MAG: SLC13 family permease [Gemmatimonadota bacterium]
MTIEIAFLFALLGAMVYLFLTEKLPVDLTAFLGLVILIFGGYLTPGEAFMGFSSPAVITMLSVFIVGAALLETGVADLIGGRVHRLVGDGEVRLVAVLMLVTGGLSAFMNNIAATAVMMPAVGAIAARTGIDPSRLFMPLAFAAVLGGTTTLVGTPPNIIAAQLLDDNGLEAFTLFDFAPVGLVILAVGIVFMLTIGRKLLPPGVRRGPAESGSGELRQVYQLDKRLFSIRIAPDSPLDGQTLANTRLGNTLGFKVLAIVRGGNRRMAPEGDAVLRSGDVLFVDGEIDDIRRLLRLRDLDVEKAEIERVPRPLQGVGAVRLGLTPGSTVVGKSLRDLAFRQRFGLVVVAVCRDGLLYRTHLADTVLSTGDEILALGKREDLEGLSEGSNFTVLERGLRVVRDLQDHFFAIRVPEGSQLVGSTIARSRLGELVGLTVAGLIRNGETVLAVSPGEVLEVGDRLLVAGDPEALLHLTELRDVELEPPDEDASIESEDVGVAEVAIAPRSSLLGRTFGELDFRGRFGLLVLALWRGGRPVHMDLTGEALRFGDALLLHGPRDRIQLLTTNPDFLVLSGADQPLRRTRRAKYAIGGLAVMVALVVGGFQPIHVAAFTAASLVLLARTLTMEEAYRAIEWRVVFLVAAVLPVGVAMERTGAAQLLADTIIAVAGPLGPYPTLAALVVMASLLSQGLDGAPAVVLMTPVVLQAAVGLDISPYPMMMGISLAASAAFMTPFSQKANLLVMGAGGYRSNDFLRVGTPLTIILLTIIVFAVPLMFPF